MVKIIRIQLIESLSLYLQCLMITFKSLWDIYWPKICSNIYICNNQFIQLFLIEYTRLQKIHHYQQLFFQQLQSISISISMKDNKQIEVPLASPLKNDSFFIEKQSEYFDVYRKFFGRQTESIINLQITKGFEQLLQKDRIQIIKDKFFLFKFEIISFSPNFEVVEIQLFWGFYKMNAQILNVVGQSIFHTCTSSCGANAKIYHINQETSSFSVKCIPISQANSQTKHIIKLRALKITSALGIGPLLTKYFGFDIIFTQECIQFALETCKPIKQFSQQSFNNMKDNLMVLHLSCVVHFDIKPDNMMWSDQFKREILIDFGLSEIINGEPGFIYPVYFKGSPNFCSPEMTLLLISQSEGFIDIYYNDVYCLKQSIKVFKLSLLEHAQQNILQIITRQRQNNEFFNKALTAFTVKEQNILLHRNRCLKIIKLKYFIYTKNQQKIDQIYQEDNSDVSILYCQALDFLRENSQVFNLKEFYQRYIPDSQKESIQNGWIQKWIRSVYPPVLLQKYQSQSEATVFYPFYKDLKDITTQQKCSLQFLSRSDMQALLYVNQVTDKASYCYYFMNFISFINNHYRVDINSKIKVCQHFIRILLPQCDSFKNYDENSNNQLIIFQYLNAISSFIINYFLSGNKMASITQLDNYRKLHLILNILQHIFFFDLFTTAQTLQFLNSIYQLEIWSYQQRFELLITLLNNNKWNSFSLFSEKSISEFQVSKWCLEKFEDLGKQNLQEKFRYVYDMFFQEFQGNIEKLLSDERINCLPMSLKMQFWLSRFPKQFYSQKQYPIVQIKIFISKHFPRFQKNGLFAIYIYFFGIFNVGYANFQQCQVICQIFKRNLISKQLLQRLILMRFIRIHQISKINERINEIAHFAKLITKQNASFLILILTRQIENILNITIQIPLSKILSGFGLDKLIEQLAKASNILDFRQQLFDKDDHSITQNKGYMFAYFALQNEISSILRRPYLNFKSELDEFQAIIYQLPNEKSRKRMGLQLIRLRIEEVILNQPENPVQTLMNLLEEYFELRSNIEDMKNIYSPNRVYLSVIQKLLMLNCYDHRLLKVIGYFYRYSKQKSLLENYMESMQISQFTSLSLVAIFQLEGFQEMIYYLKATLKYLHYTENNYTLSTMIHNYIVFFLDPKIHSQPNLTSQILSTLKEIEKKQIYIAAFYYSYIQTITSIDEICSYLKKICHFIVSMPSRIAIYFQVIIYLYIIYQKDVCLSIMMGSRPQDKEGLNNRKISRVNGKLTRLLFATHSGHSNISKINLKYTSTGINCSKKKLLVSYCRKLGAYRYLQDIIRLKLSLKR